MGSNRRQGILSVGPTRTPGRQNGRDDAEEGTMPTLRHLICRDDPDDENNPDANPLEETAEEGVDIDN